MLFGHTARSQSPWNIVVCSMAQSVVSQLTGRDLVDISDIPGSGLWKMPILV